MRALEKKFITMSPCATPYKAAEARAILGIARIALGSSGEDAPAAGAPYATTPRAIRAIPENRRRFRTTLSVASLAHRAHNG